MSESLRPFRLATLMEAVKVAELRYLEARVGGMNNATTYQSDFVEVMSRDVGGILAEMVVGRKFSRTFLPAINTFHNQADVGEDIEVRSTPHLNGSLILRDNDDPGRRYVLVICDPMAGFEVKGWCYGIEAMTDEWHMKGEGRPHWRYKGPLRSFSTLTLERPKDAPTNAETASAEYSW
jgi:hypothetical protein